MKSLRIIAASSVLALTVAVPVFAQSGSSSSSSKASHKPVVNASCMAAAVTKRDTTISTALTSVVTAIQTRGTALAAAWNMTDTKSRKAAIKAANAAFNGTWKTFNTTRAGAWKQYAADAKACKVSPSDAQTTPSLSGGNM